MDHTKPNQPDNVRKLIGAGALMSTCFKALQGLIDEQVRRVDVLAVNNFFSNNLPHSHELLKHHDCVFFAFKFLDEFEAGLRTGKIKISRAALTEQRIKNYYDDINKCGLKKADKLNEYKKSLLTAQNSDPMSPYEHLMEVRNSLMRWFTTTHTDAAWLKLLNDATDRMLAFKFFPNIAIPDHSRASLEPQDAEYRQKYAEAALKANPNHVTLPNIAVIKDCCFIRSVCRSGWFKVWFKENGQTLMSIDDLDKILGWIEATVEIACDKFVNIYLKGDDAQDSYKRFASDAVLFRAALKELQSVANKPVASQSVASQSVASRSVTSRLVTSRSVTSRRVSKKASQVR